ncbi:MAG: 3-phosphoserine/phosphohydroxythreonine transaminase [Bacteroidetes bacterium QS_9_68_14]|nr:MAG: 3-phosphoserine/phosphohydroxythreonine transaminase [Bacteroidetes bacterium QS_9_68_14]
MPSTQKAPPATRSGHPPGRLYNFSAGPATLPVEVLEEVRSELPLLNEEIGASVMEISHRSAGYDEIEKSARALIKELLRLGDEWHVLFLQGGASMQFHQVPLNFLGAGDSADYLVTGRWGKKAIREGEIVGQETGGSVREASRGETDGGFTYVPGHEEMSLDDEAAYVHFTSNNTVAGTQYHFTPEAPAPLVCDASSDFMSRPLKHPERYGLVYAGAQKNVGPAGVTIVLVRSDFLEQRRQPLPTMLDYGTHAERRFNTPPVFAVYVVEKVMRWLKAQGGVAEIEKRNEKKAQTLYDRIDATDFYRGAVAADARSKMNATFRLPSEELEERFLEEAEAEGLVSLEGHRTVGGIRASMYNALPQEAVDALVNFMDEFERRA